MITHSSTTFHFQSACTVRIDHKSQKDSGIPENGSEKAHLQVKSVNQLSSRESTRNVVLVTQNQERNAIQRRLHQKLLKLSAGLIQKIRISCVYHKYYGLYASAISLPHATKARLQASISLSIVQTIFFLGVLRLRRHNFVPARQNRWVGRCVPVLPDPRAL
jgi:hypothetical protein